MLYKENEIEGIYDDVWKVTVHENSIKFENNLPKGKRQGCVCELIRKKQGREGSVKLPGFSYAKKFRYLNNEFEWFEKDGSKTTWKKSWNLKNAKMTHDFNVVLYNKEIQKQDYSIEICSIRLEGKGQKAYNQYCDDVLREDTTNPCYNKGGTTRNKERIKDLVEAISGKKKWQYAKFINDFNSNKILVILKLKKDKPIYIMQTELTPSS